MLDAICSGDSQPQEIIVVDGLSTDRTADLARQYPVTVAQNPHVHAAAARNIGIGLARGDVVAFTDSDCVPQSDWLLRIAEHFSVDPELTGIGGKVCPLPPVNEVEAFSGSVFLEEIMCFPKEVRVIETRTLAGALITGNCAYRRNALLAIGCFNEWFSNHGEDIDLFWRFIAAGHKLLYDPAVAVGHSFPYTRKALARKYVQYGISSSKLARHHLATPHIDLLLYRKLGQNLVGLLTNSPSRDIASLYCIQLGSHILGKLYGSLVARCINL